jgi:hypothetical protein
VRSGHCPPQLRLLLGATIQEHGTLTKRRIAAPRQSAGTSSKPIHNRIAQLGRRIEQGKWNQPHEGNIKLEHNFMKDVA